MKMVKSLLLGSAAGLVAVAGAQAADLPVKAKPVEYVKVCSLYGAGFWYVPGTDTCLKIGSFVREEIGWNQSGTTVTGFQTGGGQFTRTDTSQLAMRTRADISVDLRTQTEYGVLRSYLEGGFESTSVTGGTTSNDVVWFDRGFIQFAGLTAGRIRSYFDINSPYEFGYFTQATTGDSNTFRGLWGIAYTADFGNGFSGSLSLEDGGSSSQGNNAGQARSRTHKVVNLSLAGQWGLGTESFDNEGWKFPDVVGALRIDQAWGYAQISAALHDASAGYYTSPVGDACGANAFCQNLGHPGDAWGWAVSGGFHLNDVLGLKGDTFALQATYSVGAAGYATNNISGAQVYGGGNQAAFGWVNDGVFITGSGVELTTVWSLNGGFQHFWNPKWRTGVYGGYTEIDYSGTAAGFICGGGVGGAVAAPAGVAMTGVSNCQPNWSFYQVGSRTQWNPHPDLDIGVDVMWTHINTAFGGTATLAANGARPPGVYSIADQDVISAVFRIQRNFLP
ncbi:MAG TPA: porin [Xanthobacteraceae bacterium]|nr:porin [Xanthobacteraceae bacterium]